MTSHFWKWILHHNRLSGPMHAISVLIAFALLPLIHAHAGVSSEAVCLCFGLSFKQRRLWWVCAYAARRCKNLLGPDKEFVHLKLHLHVLPYQSVKTCVLGAQKNRLIETVLLSTHNTCFGWEIRKQIFQYAILSGGLTSTVISCTGLNRQSTWGHYSYAS